jgi:hypothetical protein
MATHRIPRPGVPGRAPGQYDYQSLYEQDSVQLPVRPNIGLAAGLVLAMGSILALLVYYVL